MQRSPRRRLGKSAWPMKVTLIHWLARQLTARLAQSTPRLLRRLRPLKAAADTGAKAEAEAFHHHQLRMLPPRAEAVAALTPLWQASGRQEHQCGQPVRLPDVPYAQCREQQCCPHHAVAWRPLGAATAAQECQAPCCRARPITCTFTDDSQASESRGKAGRTPICYLDCFDPSNTRNVHLHPDCWNLWHGLCGSCA
jgi:hypothetical protein